MKGSVSIFKRITVVYVYCFVVMLFLGLVSPIAAAQGNEQPVPKSNCLTVEDIFNLEEVSDPQISPDGKQIVYVRRFVDIMTDKRYSNIRIINFDGTGHRPLTGGKFNDSSPCWSADGRQLIYVSNKDGSAQVYKRWMDTGQTVVLSNLQQSPGSLSWSPDGKWIAFTANVPSKPRTIIKMPEPPKGAEWAKPAKVIDRLNFRFNRSGYSYGERYSHLFVMPAEGGTPRQLSGGDFNHNGPLTWTPDSKYIILSANRRKDHEIEFRDTDIYRFSTADGTIKALTDRRGPDSSPVVSPNGKTIAYIGFDDRYQGFQLRQLYVMNPDGSGSRVVLKDFDHSVSRLRWDGKSKGIYFLYSHRGNTKLAYTSLSGKVKTLAGDVRGRGSYSVAANGGFVITITRPQIPSEIAVGTFANPKVRVLTNVNRDVLGHKQLGEVEETWYSSSLDGRKIQGWIIKPPQFDPAKKYPLILTIHGGPFANYGSRFDIEKQLMAAGGYVVLYTNPRGSTGYGEEFANLIHHAYPGDDFYDLNSGVDAIIEKGYIDTDNLFVTGGSGGGVLTCWMIGRTTRFRAAVTVYPVINWYSWTLTSDIPFIGVKYWFPGMPWDHADHYEKRNLLSVVKNVKTPTMVLCGEEDWRTPISESEQYYRALKLLGVESVLVRVPGEPHGIRVRPSHHISKILHIIEWFNQHKVSKQ
jgi:dipeptidyl aminopeptidase/acylaminoacyl peptidase